VPRVQAQAFFDLPGFFPGLQAQNPVQVNKSTPEPGTGLGFSKIPISTENWTFCP